MCIHKYMYVHKIVAHRPRPIMIKFFPIILLSNTQKSYRLCSTLCSYFSNMLTNFNKLTALLKFIYIRTCSIKMFHKMIVLLDYIDLFMTCMVKIHSHFAIICLLCWHYA